MVRLLRVDDDVLDAGSPLVAAGALSPCSGGLIFELRHWHDLSIVSGSLGHEHLQGIGGAGGSANEMRKAA
jgi:hypothetical protein